jgi:hypothetical protein
MPPQRTDNGYRPTESKYKGGANEFYIVYDLDQRTRSGETALYPKVKRVYIAGRLKDWTVGDFKKKSGKRAHGVKIDYEQIRRGYRRRAFTATRMNRSYNVPPTTVKPSTQSFTQVVEVPLNARNVRLQTGELPPRYREALQNVR